MQLVPPDTHPLSYWMSQLCTIGFDRLSSPEHVVLVYALARARRAQGGCSRYHNGCTRCSCLCTPTLRAAHAPDSTRRVRKNGAFQMCTAGYAGNCDTCTDVLLACRSGFKRGRKPDCMAFPTAYRSDFPAYFEPVHKTQGQAATGLMSWQTERGACISNSVAQQAPQI
jgi:hypothetical protein